MSIEWISNDYTLFLDEREIGSMVYVGDTPEKGSSRELYYNSCIDTSLPIGKEDFKSEKLDYGEFLKYNELTPDERATYLHWLASPRKSKHCRSDFVRLYISGLEYRFFKDDSDIEEKKEIYKEVERLSRFYGNRIYLRWSFYGFLNTAQAMVSPSNFSPTFREYNADRSLAAAIAIGRDIASGIPVTAERSLAWWRWDSDSRLGRSYYGCSEEFLPLYKNLFDEKYPNGLVVAPSKQNLVDRYSAQFGRFAQRIEFEVNGKPVPDISEMKEPLEIIKSIVDEALESLKKLGLYRYRKPKLQNILEENSLIPASIRDEFSPYGISELKSWLKDKGPNSHFTIKRLYDKLYFKAPKTVSLSLYRKICDDLAKLGYSLTPDPRLTSPPPKVNDNLLVFPVKPSEDHITGVSGNLLAAIVEIGMGVYIAKTFGKMTPAKTKALEQIIKRQVKNKPAERTVLNSHLSWLLKNPPEKAVFRKFLRQSDESHNKSIRQTVINVARATGAANPKVIAYVEEVYKLLGLDSVAAYSDLHAGEIVEKPKTTKQAENVKTTKVSKAGNRQTKRVKLNEGKIKALSNETLEVSILLSNIFSEETLGKTKPSTTKNRTSKSTRSKSKVKRKNPSSIHSVFRGLETKHIPLTIELLSKVRWTDKQVAKLAIKHSLMWQGSLEVINEWAHEQFEGELIEEYDGYRPNVATVKKLRQRMQAVSRK